MQKPISRQLFKECITALQNEWDMLDEIDNVCHKYMPDTSIFYMEDGPANALTKLLETIFCDEQDGWIGYYCYELNFGRGYHPGMITDKNGSDIPLATTDDLYNLLTQNMKDNREE